jgi:hypothetical protein
VRSDDRAERFKDEVFESESLDRGQRHQVVALLVEL